MTSSAPAHSAGRCIGCTPGPLNSLKIVIKNLQFLQHVQAKTPICVPGASLGRHHRNMERLHFPANTQYFTSRHSSSCQMHPRRSPNRPKMSQGLPQGPSMTQDACPRAPLMHPKLSNDRQMARRWHLRKTVFPTEMNTNEPLGTAMGPQGSPRGPQDRSMGTHDAPRCPQVPLRGAHDLPKSYQNCAKTNSGHRNVSQSARGPPKVSLREREICSEVTFSTTNSEHGSVISTICV